jgi:hypothetical protein
MWHEVQLPILYDMFAAMEEHSIAEQLTTETFV